MSIQFFSPGFNAFGSVPIHNPFGFILILDQPQVKKPKKKVSCTRCTQIKFRGVVSPLGNRPSSAGQKLTIFYCHFFALLLRCFCFSKPRGGFSVSLRKRWNKAKRLFCLALIKVLIGFAKKRPK